MTKRYNIISASSRRWTFGRWSKELRAECKRVGVPFDADHAIALYDAGNNVRNALLALLLANIDKAWTRAPSEPKGGSQ